MAARILVIDDKQDSCTSVGDLLNQEGYQVIWSSPLLRNLITLEWLQPDLIVVDTSPYEAWQLLRRLTIHRPTFSIPIIICTDAAHAGIAEREHMVGACAEDARKERLVVLNAPFTTDELVGMVRSSLSARGSDEQLAS